MLLNSENIVHKVTQKAALPNNQIGLSTQDILDYASLEMQTSIMIDILRNPPSFNLFQDTFPITVGQEYLRIPYRAVCQSLEYLYWLNPNNDRFDIALANNQDEVNLYTSANNLLYPKQFIIEGNNIRLLPVAPQSGTLVITYPFRPSSLVPSANVTTITAINTGTNTITVSSLPSGFQNNVAYDIINNVSGNEIIQYDNYGTLGTNTITFTTALASNVAVGQIVALAGQSNYPMLPEELHELVVEQTVAMIFLAKGFDQQYQNQLKRVEVLKQRISTMLNQRISGKFYQVGGANPFTALPFLRRR